MATDVKDFKVKHGLLVATTGTFGDVVEHADPTQPSHSATRRYVDSRPITIVDWEVPATPIDGTMWVDLNSNQILTYYGGAWLVTGTFSGIVDGGTPSSMALSTVDAGTPTSDPTNLLDGGTI